MAINLWRRFEELIKPAGEEVVTVKVKHTDGTITGETLTGGTMRARCSFDVEAGERLFVAGGEARGKAPGLAYHEIEI